jgi:hypothetical protein
LVEINLREVAVGYKLGPIVLMPQYFEGPKIPIPSNSMLTQMMLGKNAKDGPRYLKLGCSSIEETELKLGEEYSLPPAIPPFDGGGNVVHIPAGTIVSALELGSLSLTIWYRKVTSPPELLSEDEVRGRATYEPENNGDGDIRSMPNSTMTGFQWERHADRGFVGLNIWYRALKN